MMGLPVKMVHKLFLAILGGIAITAVLLSLLTYWSVNRGLLGYVNHQEAKALSTMIEPLKQEYLREGSWEGFSQKSWLWREFVETHYMAAIDPNRALRPMPGPPPGPNPGMRRNDRPPPRPGQRPHRPRGQDLDGQSPRGGEARRGDGMRPPRGGANSIGRRVLLLDNAGDLVFGHRHAAIPKLRTNIEINNEVVGQLAVVPRKKLTAEIDLNFLKSLTRTFMGIVALLLLLSAALAMLLARHWGGRLQVLADSARALSSGKFTTRVAIESGDEMAQLGRDFNNLANTLARNEKSRQRWMAEISHELRTPLAILRGELEALQDGVRQFNPDILDSLIAEIGSLTKLVDDLYELSRADLGGLGYRKQRMDALLPLRHVLQSYSTRIETSGLQLEEWLPLNGQAMLLADGDRLKQLFNNLMENAVRYTKAGGLIQVIATLFPHQLEVVFSDAAPGLEAEECKHIFDHFVRGSSSHDVKTSGSGLGLAICRSIVTAHEGRIHAEPSPLGGVSFIVKLPLDGQ